jgi:hypothetical protein
MSGTNRISVDALSGNLLAPTSLEGLIDAYDQRISVGHEHLHQQPYSTRLAFRLDQLA